MACSHYFLNYDDVNLCNGSWLFHWYRNDSQFPYGNCIYRYWKLHAQNQTELHDWNKTHRMSSWLFIIGGILFCINGFFKMTEVLFVVIILIAVVPMAYSFVLYKKGIWWGTDNLRHRNTTLIKTLTGLGWHFLCYLLQVNPLWAIVPLLYYRIEKRKLQLFFAWLGNGGKGILKNNVFLFFCINEIWTCQIFKERVESIT